MKREAMSECACVEPKDLERVWPSVREWLERARREGFDGCLHLAQIAQRLDQGRYTLVLIAHGGELAGCACIELIAVGPDDVLTLECVLAGGRNMQAWLPAAMEFMRLCGREARAVNLRVSGRVGWRRTLRAHGFKTKHITMERKL